MERPQPRMEEPQSVAVDLNLDNIEDMFRLYDIRWLRSF